MGSELVTECMGTPSDDLTWRERFALLVLAAEACDATRLCPPGIESDPEIIARLRLSRSARYEVLSQLCAKAVLVHVERGRNANGALYAIAPYDLGSGRPGDPDAPAVKGPGNQDATTGSKGPGFPDATALKGPGSTTQGSGNPGPLTAEGSGFHVVKGPGSTDASRARSGSLGFKDLKPPPTPQPPLMVAVPNPGEGEGANTGSGKPGRFAEHTALAAEIRELRPEWSARSVIRALERPAVAERPWPIVAAAARIMAADPATGHPGRLEHDGPWWPQAARATRTDPKRSAAPGGQHEFEDDPSDPGRCVHCHTPESNWHHAGSKARPA